MIVAIYRITDGEIIRWCVFDEGTVIEYSIPSDCAALENCPNRDASHVIDGELVTNPKAPTVPQVISRFQGRAALLNHDLLAAAEALIAQADAFTKLAWAEATEWRRGSPTVEALATGLELTSEQLDALFIEAAQIQA